MPCMEIAVWPRETKSPFAALYIISNCNISGLNSYVVRISRDLYNISRDFDLWLCNLYTPDQRKIVLLVSICKSSTYYLIDYFIFETELHKFYVVYLQIFPVHQKLHNFIT